MEDDYIDVQYREYGTSSAHFMSGQVDGPCTYYSDLFMYSSVLFCFFLQMRYSTYPEATERIRGRTPRSRCRTGVGLTPFGFDIGCSFFL